MRASINGCRGLTLMELLALIAVIAILAYWLLHLVSNNRTAVGMLFLLALNLGLVSTAWVLSYRLTPKRLWPKNLRWLMVWSIKGFLVPMATWAILNVGLAWNLQPFMPQVQAAQNSGRGWLGAFFRVLDQGGFIISSAWTAGTLAWVLAQTVAGAEEEARASFKALCRICLIGMVLPALGLVLLGGWPMLGLAATAILAPIAGCAPAIFHTRRRTPFYSRAIARMKLGKYSEAEWEIIRQLEECEDDFQGWMMLAELYACHFHDLPEAERTILEACDQPRTSPPQLSLALHRLADWHLKLRADPAAAKWTLQIICDRLKGTHLAHMAQLRINQLPESAEELRETQGGKPIPLPALGDNLDSAAPEPGSKLERRKAAEMANACVEKLKQDPNNVSARERLARLFAEQLDRADQGIEQLGLLLGMPDQPEARRAEWLGLTAAWHLKYRRDSEAAREILERLVREFSQTPQALAAQRRIRLMNEERYRR